MSSLAVVQSQDTGGDPAPEGGVPAALEGCSSVSGADVPPQALERAPEPQPTPGQRLHAARERLGLTISEVASQLKLAPRQVEALERDDHAALPGEVFARGFLRNYARLLDLDARSFGAETPAAVETPPATAESPMAAVAAAGPPPSLAIAMRRTRRRGNRPVVTWALAGAALLLALVLAMVLRESVPMAPAPAASPGAVADAQTPGLNSAAVEPPAGGAGTLSAATAAGEALLQFRFSRDAWVEVRDGGGQVILSQINPPGSAREVLGRPPLNIVVGNASGVELRYRGDLVDLAPYTRTEVARFTLE